MSSYSQNGTKATTNAIWVKIDHRVLNFNLDFSSTLFKATLTI